MHLPQRVKLMINIIYVTDKSPPILTIRVFSVVKKYLLHNIKLVELY